MKPLFAFLLLGSLSTASAQSQLTVPPDMLPEVRIVQPDTPAVRVVYDVQERRIRSVEPLAPEQLALGTFCFDNSAGPKVASVVTDPGEELVDWGVKSCGESGLLRSFTMMYLNSTYPGVDGAMSLALFQGTRGWNRLGTEIFRETITGLPNGYAELVVDFGDHPLPLGDGPIGWSVLQLDGHTGPIMVTAPDASLGTVDALDLFVPGPAVPESYVGTFNYGSCSHLCGSLFIQLDEIPRNQTALSMVVNGTGANPVLLHEVFPARLGQTWVARVDISGYPLGTSTLLVASLATTAPIAHPFGELLLDPARVIAGPLTGVGGHLFTIPSDASLAGFHLFVQALVLPLGPPALPPILTNALGVRIGY
jgi:hypothetical protein